MRITLKSIGSHALRGGRWICDGLKPPFGTIGHALKPLAGGGLLSGIRHFLLRQIISIRLERALERADAPDPRDFHSMLSLWGIAPDAESIRRCIAGLVSRCICVCGMSVIFISLILHQWTGRLSQWLVVLTFSCLILIVVPTHVWRISVLRRRKFIPFHGWLMGGK